MSIRPTTFARCALDQDGLRDDGRMGRIEIRSHSAWKNATSRILHHGHLTDANMNVTALVLEDEEDVWIVFERYTYDAGRTARTDVRGRSAATNAQRRIRRAGGVACDGGRSGDEDGTDYDNVILFAGYYRDPETHFYHIRNRFHHAELGRWHQRDPIGYADGMSLYEYVGR